MTGQRRIRGRLDDDQHDRQVGADRQPAANHVELEELSVARVVPRGRARIGLPAIVATGSLAVLLAAGFGALGGKPSASQAAAAANGSGTSSARPGPTVPGLAPGVTPAATPWTACGAPPTAAPNVLLEVDGIPYPGDMEVLQASGGAIPAPSPIPSRERLLVSTNVPAALWIVGAACANAWSIGFPSATVDDLGNAGLNPLYASQNRFDLFLAPFGGLNADLTADLTFQTLAVRATWHVAVQPYEHPSTYIATRSEGETPVEGCNFAVTLDNGWTTAGEPCGDGSGDVRERPDAAIPVIAGESLSFAVSQWTILSASIRCGSLDGYVFVGDPAATCEEGEAVVPAEGVPTEVRFVAPHAKGRWTLAIDACASMNDWMGTSQACGTWFADVDVAASSGR
ncbi:MAG: hypothetical protein HYX55_07550 [Chloroflexi bacterium]|nr:hypothetical protein [Chloroflexota bacterium]